jgi:hypothetical protein
MSAGGTSISLQPLALASLGCLSTNGTQPNVICFALLPVSIPYSPECVEGEFCEVHIQIAAWPRP